MNLRMTFLKNAGQVPIGFSITINASKFDQSHIYGVRASIYDGDRMLFTTQAPQGVDLEKLDGLIEVVMERAG